MHAIRRRTVASAVAALFAAAPLAMGGAAYAEEPATETGSQVVFTGGGLLGLACDAKPSSSSVTVPAESTLRIVNNTGRKAKLLLDGAERGQVASGATADVLFHRGPVELALKPDCMLSGEKAVRVEVLAAPPSNPDAPSEDPGTSPGGGGNTGGTGRNGGSSGGGTPSARGGDDNRPQDRTRDDDGDGNPDPVSSADPEGTPGSEPTEGAEDGAAIGDDFFDPTAGSGAESPTTVAGAAAEPLASVDPISDSAPTGLLALIATVCVVGVSAGAIRAIIAQRATRTRAA